MKMGVQTETHTPILPATLLVTAKKWYQPKRPSAHEWTNQMGRIQTAEQYSAIRGHKALTLATLGINPENIMLSERHIRTRSV